VQVGWKGEGVGEITVIADIAGIARDRKAKSKPLINTDETDPEYDREERSEAWNVWRRIERSLPA
jgi:hypothetical protein